MIRQHYRNSDASDDQRLSLLFSLLKIPGATDISCINYARITCALTLSYYRISCHFEQLFVILIIMTPADGSVIHGQQVLIMFMCRVPTNRVKQVMHSLH